MISTINFTRVNNDTFGNPRYVCHFLNLLTQEEIDSTGGILNKYAIACKRANSIGGRKYTTKSYGGGIVFKSYNLDEKVKAINRVTGRDFTDYECN